MSDLPKFVEFHEEGPREGFQFESKRYPLEQRRELVHRLADTGLGHIQVASFVHPKKVPQMADSEALFESLVPREGVAYTGLWLNEQGFERARRARNITLTGKLSYYPTDAFCLSNNGCTALEMAERQRNWAFRYREIGLPIEVAYVLTAFGCNMGGPVAPSTVVDIVRGADAMLAEQGGRLPAVMLCDTVGWANPDAVTRLVGAVREALPDVRVGLHLHDTRGLGAANVLAALRMGVELFDSSVAGLGGCPFCGHTSAAAGNVCTEDMVFMCHEMGIETGIDLEALIDAALYAESIIGRPLAGHVMHAGSLRSHRHAVAA